jgi:hypothetical protein
LLSELVQRNLSAHLEEGTNHHLHLSAKRILEQQSVILGINKRLNALEAQVDNSATKVGVVQTTTAASVAAVALATKHLSDKVDEDMQTMEKRHKNESLALQKSLTQTNSAVSGLDQRVSRMSAAAAAAAVAARPTAGKG